MLAALLLTVCAIINISLIIALIWKITSTANEMMNALKLPNVSYWDISNLIFLNKPISSTNPVITEMMKQFQAASSSYSNVVAGLRGLLWFILIQGILQVLLAFAWPSIPSYTLYQGGGRRR